MEKDEQKTKQFCIKMTEDEKEDLRVLAEYHKRPMANMIKYLISEALMKIDIED